MHDADDTAVKTKTQNEIVKNKLLHKFQLLERK